MSFELPPLRIISANSIQEWLNHHPYEVFDIVRQTYLTHHAGKTVNPDSYFLRFPDSDRNRIIALPASIENEKPVAGIKWIASFPENVTFGGDRASALLVLNDRKTGYPLACLEGSLISAARTAAAAAVGARYMHPTPGQADNFAIIGCGPIAYGALKLMVELSWKIGVVTLVDLSEERVALFAAKCESLGLRVAKAGLENAIRQSDLQLFATSAVSPFVHDVGWYTHAPTVLHMSLRDLAPEIIVTSQNVADDIDHCLKARTSLELAAIKADNRDFVAGHVGGAILGHIVPDVSRPRIFSPFGMGVLDLAVAQVLLNTIRDADIVTINGFFPTPFIEQSASSA